MAENELQIVLTLLDKATGELKKSMGEVKKETDSVKKSSDEASKSMAEGFKDAGKQVREFRQTMLAVTLSIGVIIGVTKEWSKHNQETHKALGDIGESMKRVTALIGSLFAPTITAFADMLNKMMPAIESFFKVIQEGWQKFFTSISYGIQYLIAFSTAMLNGMNIAQAHEIATRTAGMAAEEMGAKFSAAMVDNLPQLDAMTDKIRNVSKAYWELKAEIENTDYSRQMSTLKSATDLMQTMASMQKTMWSSVFDFINMGIKKFSTGFSSAISAIILHTKSAKEAFAEFGKMMIQSIVEFVVQYAVQALISLAIGKLIAKFVGSIADQLAAQWAEPAYLASVATLGAAAGIGTAALLGGAGVAMGGLATIQKAGKALITVEDAGGSGPSGGWAKGTDSVPAMLTPGEMIFPKTMADAIRRGDIIVGGREQNNSNQYVNIEINNPIVNTMENIAQLVDEISYRLNRETARV